jgi:hypothetical protein
MGRMTMFGWMSGVSREESTRNEYMRGSIGVMLIVYKFR